MQYEGCNGGEAASPAPQKEEPSSGPLRFSMALCEICGNESAAGDAPCRFCGSERIGDAGAEERSPFSHKYVNLKQGMPLVEAAMQRLSRAIHSARYENVRVLILIHGYGSGGKGGGIRRECRKTLDHMRGTGMIAEYIPGENLTPGSGAGKTLLRRFPELQRDVRLNRNNRGITVVVFSR